VASAGLSLLDTPQNLAQVALNPEYGFIGGARKLYNQITDTPHEPLKSPDVIENLEPNIVSNTVKRGTKNYLDFDLEPRPSNRVQRGIKHVGEFATPFGVFGTLNKGAKALNALKGVGWGSAIGATSDVLQEEGGTDPLVADIGASLTVPLIPAAGMSLFNKFRKTQDVAKSYDQVAKALKTQIGEENVPEVLENIQKYKQQKKPINLQPTTPELAQNVGLSRLYRTQTNNDLIPLRYKENDIKLRDALEKIGTTGLEESVKGEAIRTPFFDKFKNKKARRERLTAPLYEELENIQTGLPTPAAASLLEKEISVSSPGHKGLLERFKKSLSRNDVSPLTLKKIGKLEKDLKLIDTMYPEATPQSMSKIKAPLLHELEQLKLASSPRPIQIENTIQELGDKVNALSRSGEANAARKYRNLKKAYETDLSTNPVGLKHREEYKRLSKPINEIETSPLLNNFVKENKDVNKLNGFVVPSEKIPNLIIGSDLANTKILMNKAKGNPETLALIKGTYIDELLNKATLSNGHFSYDKANKFLNNKYNKEKLEVIFNNKEKKKLDYFLERLEKRNKVETQGKVSGSDTHQKLKVEEEFNKSLEGLNKLMGNLPVHTTVTSEVSKLIKNSLAKNRMNTQKRYDNILSEALVDPNTFKRLMKGEYQKPKVFKDYYNTTPHVALGSVLLNKKSN
jgi:hypothetical protein